MGDILLYSIRWHDYCTESVSPFNDGGYATCDDGANIMRTFYIPASRKSIIEDKLHTLEKKSKKLGLPQLTWEFGTPEVREMDVLVNDPKRWVKKNIWTIAVDIEGPINISFDGWIFLASLQHTQEGNIINVIVEGDYSNYRNTKPTCDHCNINRKRNTTYLVAKNGVIKQVGSSCLQDFVGHNSPDDVCVQAAFISEIVKYFDSDISESDAISSNKNYFELKKFLEITAASVRQEGWISRSSVFETNQLSTVDKVLDIIFDKKEIQILDKDKELASKAIDWALNLSEDTSDYLHNLKTIAKNGYVELANNSGYAASLISAYNKSLTFTTAVSNHIGKPKDKISLDVIFKNKYSVPSMYGTLNILIFEDLNGNKLVWKTSTYQELETNNKYSLTATVKKHTTYKDINQTEITRACIK